MNSVQFEDQDTAIEQSPFEEAFLRFMQITLKCVFGLFSFFAIVLIITNLFF